MLKISDVSYINLHPPVEFGKELFEKYKKSDIQVITSKSEGIPRTIVEGASFSLPLISTNVGGISTNIIDKHNGLFIETGDVNSLVEAITEVINNKELRQTIIRNGFEMARNMTIETMSDLMANKINSVILNKDMECDIQQKKD